MAVCLLCVTIVLKNAKKIIKKNVSLQGKISKIDTRTFFNHWKCVFSDGTDTHTDKHTNRTTDITDRRLNWSKGRFSENQTETDIFSGWLPSVTTRQNNLVLTMTMRMTMTMMMTMMMLVTMTMTMTIKHLYSSLSTNLVGRNEPVVSLRTYSELTEYMAAMRGQILSSFSHEYTNILSILGPIFPRYLGKIRPRA